MMDKGRTGATATPPTSTPPPTPASGQGGATAQDVAREARDAASGVAQEVAQEVQRQTTARLEEQVGHAAERLGGVSQAMQAVGRQLREQDDAMMAQWAERAADQVDRFAGYLRGKDLDELVYEGERFARRQPALFLGGAFALGLVAARFLKSSGRRDDRYEYGRQDWPTYYGRPPSAPREYAPPRYGATGAYGDAAAPQPPAPRMGAMATGTPGMTGTSGTGMTGDAGASGHTGTRHPGAPADPR